MMNITAEEGCRTIIGYLSDEEIFTLLDTVTKKQIQTTGKEEAIDAIISYTDTAEQFLQRQKIKREMIFKYLHSEKVHVSASSNKKTLITTVIKTWENKDSRMMEMDDAEEEVEEVEVEVPKKAKRGRKSKSAKKDAKTEAVPPEQDKPVTVKTEQTDTVKPAPSSSQPTPTTLPQPGQLDTLQAQTTNTIQAVTDAALQHASVTSPPPPPTVTRSDIQNGSGLPYLAPQINVHVHINQFSNNPIPAGMGPDGTSMAPGGTSVAPGGTSMGPGGTSMAPGVQMISPGSGNRTYQDIQPMNTELQALGEKFVKWFYDNLNSFNLTCVLNMQDFGPQHFWDDVHLEIEVYTPHLSNEVMDGPVLVSQRLLAFTKEDDLLFNPNISPEGVFVKSSPHGLVKILACGSVHRRNACLGIFQQAFGIIRDPRFDNNWKIKYLKLQLKTGEVLSLPKLEGDVESQIQALVPL